MPDESKRQTFCILPWIHLNVIPEGKVLPCCIVSHQEEVGHVKTHTLEQIAKSEAMTEIRRQMLAGERPSRCRLCYATEDLGGRSHRTYMNEVFSNQIGAVDFSKADGKIDDFKMAYWDIRFSNICNFRCRTCTPALSSSWNHDHARMQNLDPAGNGVIRISDSTDMWNQLKAHLRYVEEVYMIGGEPTLEEQQWKIIEFLKSEGLQQKVRLRYNTNLSSLKTLGRDVFEQWRQFKHVEVIVSLDGMGSRGEYIRKGLDWKVMNENLAALRKLGHVRIWVNFLVSIFNGLHLADFAHETLLSGLIHPQELILSPLTDPEYYSITVLPAEFKMRVATEYRKTIQKMRVTDADLADQLEQKLSTVIAYMNSQDHSQLLPDFLKMTKQLDAIRGESFKDIFPEYTDLLTAAP